MKGGAKKPELAKSFGTKTYKQQPSQPQVGLDKGKREGWKLEKLRFFEPERKIRCLFGWIYGLGFLEGLEIPTIQGFFLPVTQKLRVLSQLSP